ncbi:MAG: pyridoxamine 5'-phosphate oxidase family protein [Phycisphaeraceae bacterium]|nr:pyridoxamine 5'-phosphate oxidase family protein [Phycisphaeraceae bacterium]
MSSSRTTIDAKTAEFIRSQRLFFVATAPRKADGLINLSPKGLDTFVVLDECTVAYLDLTGSGIETVAHLKENGRIVVMFCAFEGAPNILRLHGRGEVVEMENPEFAAIAAVFPPRPGARAVIRIHVKRVSYSCGFGVPLMEFRGHRTRLEEHCEQKGEAGLREYRERKNRTSLEGLPGLG